MKNGEFEAPSEGLEKPGRLNINMLVGVGLAGIAIALLAGYDILHLSGFSFGQAVYKVNDYDEGVYVATGALMAHGYSLYSQIYSAQPPLLPAGLALVDRLFGVGLAQARAVIMVFGIIAVLATATIAGQARGWIAAGIAAILLVLSPEFLVYSHAVEEELPMMALSAVSLAMAIVWWKRSTTATAANVSRSHGQAGSAREPLAPKTAGRELRVPGWVPAAVSGLFFGLAILTKFFAFALLVPLAVMVILYLMDRGFTVRTGSKDGPRAAPGPVRDLRPPGSRPLQASRISRLVRDAVIFVAAAAAPVIGSFLLLGGDEWQQMVSDRVSASSGNAASFQGESNIHTVLDLVHTDPGLAILAVCGGLLILISDWRLGLILDGWALATMAVLLRYHPLFGHHVIILLVPAAVLAGTGASYALPRPAADGNSWRGTSILGKSIMAGAGLGVLAYLVLVPRLATSYDKLLVRPYGLDTTLASAGAAVQARTPPNGLVAAGDAWICVDANRLCVPDLVDTSDVRIATGKLTAIQAIDATQPAETVALGRRLCENTGTMAPYVKWVEAHYTAVKRMPLESTGCRTGIYIRRHRRVAVR